jgi:hypothetical protein
MKQTLIYILSLVALSVNSYAVGTAIIESKTVSEIHDAGIFTKAYNYAQDYREERGDVMLRDSIMADTAQSACRILNKENMNYETLLKEVVGEQTHLIPALDTTFRVSAKHYCPEHVNRLVDNPYVKG